MTRRDEQPYKAFLCKIVLLTTLIIPAVFPSSSAADERQSAENGKDKGTTLRGSDAEKVELVSGLPALLRWKSTGGKDKGFVVCLHELGMHKGAFENVGERLAAEGYTVYSMDLRGFGGWEGKGDEGKMDLKNTLADIKKVVDKLKSENKETPVFLLGEAMGGALALEAASEFPDIISGIISAAPGGEHFRTLHNYISVGTRFAAGNKRSRAKGEELLTVATPKKDLQQAFRKDQGVRLDLSPKELMACQFYMYKTKRFASRIAKMPVLIVQGQKDGESRPEGAQKVYDNLATKEKQYMALENGDHYVYEDTNVDAVAMKQTVSWLDKYAE